MGNNITEHHIYTNKRYVLLEISSKLKYDYDNDFKYFDILVFKHKGDKQAEKPTSYKGLEQLLDGVDKVYSFDRVETMLHGAIGYDIIIEE